MRRYLFSMLVIFAVAGGYLSVRKMIDRRVEKNTGTEIVREHEEYLGSWASKSDEGFVMFRLHRDGQLTYRLLRYPGNDTTTINGTYAFVTGRGYDAQYFPRLYGFGENGDTLFNYYVRYYTKYDMTIDKVDKMILSPNSVYDTLAYTYYRIKQ